LNLELDGNGNGIIEPLELASNGEWWNGSLEMWHCENCGLSGSFPGSIENLNHLKNLDLSDNYLSGEIPENIGNLSQLTYIALSNNYLSGDLSDNFINFLYDANQSAGVSFDDDYIATVLANNSFCEPFSDYLLDLLGSSPGSESYLQAQECNPRLKIIYPIEGRPRYTGDGFTPVALIVNNFVVGDTDCSDCDGHFHWQVDGAQQPNEYNIDPFGIENLDDGGHLLYVELRTTYHSILNPQVNESINFEIYAPVYGCMDYSYRNHHPYSHIQGHKFQSL
jgi:hypothetical protein